ncbi:hypothetical protein [Tenacibaculum amylolyticum]|uniref:hypothetical protein n=1 Tax=Tenacibaculum amylolyticum TaxID=104269 RepID=UPI00389596CF
MKNKKYLSLLIVVLCFYSCKTVNKLDIKTGEGINLEKIRLELKVFSDDSKFKNVVVFNGKSYREIPNAYGENDWKIYYNDTLVKSFGHFKTNRNDRNNYEFHFDMINDEFRYSIAIKGNDELILSNK